MSYKVEERADGKIIEVHIEGKLNKEAYEMFVPLTEKRIEEFGKIRLLVILHDFHGWDMSALWEDLKFDVKHFSDIERLAIVGDSKWEQGMSVFCRPFTTAKMKYFDIADVEAA